MTLEDIERRNAARRRQEPSPTPTATPAPVVRRPRIVDARIPFPASRKREMAAYAQRHYGVRTYRLTDPKVIVEHHTETASAAAAIALFRPDTPDPELHELPNVCAHFVVDRDGTIDAVVPLGIMCRHTVGLNDTAIGVEHAGFSAQDVLSNRAELRASLRLTRWLQCRYGIPTSDVIGHHESLGSRFHHERVAPLRTQTHDDFTQAEMAVYRRHLGRGCPAR